MTFVSAVHRAMPWRLAKATAGDDIAELDVLTAALSRRLRKAFMDAVAALADRIPLDDIVELLRAGRVGEAIDRVKAEAVQSGYESVARELSDATVTAARHAVRLIPPLQGVDFSFGQMNPAVTTALHAYEMDKIREISAEALASVRATITAGVQDGRNPIDVARDVRAHIGLTERQTQAVVNYRRVLEARDRTALDRALRDRRFDGSVARAIRDGKPLGKDKIDTMVDRYRARYLRYRAETIARTEAIRALNRGAILGWQQQIDDGKIDGDLVTKKWIYTPDNRTRHAHRTIPAMNKDGVGLNEPFQSELGPIRYPGDPNAMAANVVNCRCAMVIRYAIRD